MHPGGAVLYSVGNVRGEPSVSAFRVERVDGRPRLQPMGSQPVGDGGAAHLATDRSGKVLMTAQYGGGSVAVFPLGEDGSIGPRSHLAEHSHASGVLASRQEAPHPHWVGTSPDNRFVFVPDLGADRVLIYRLDTEAAKLSEHGYAETPPGGGPRHMKFSPDGRFAYVLNELILSVTVFGYDADAGTMATVQTIETLPESAKAKEGFNSASEVRMHPSGRFLYTANRGNDTVSVFRIDPQDGTLAHVENEPIRGSWPRNFNLDPTGRWLLAAGRDSNTLTVFAVDGKTGELAYQTHGSVFVPSPICVVVVGD
ncbi:MAG: lactonase family protein, partial [Planctomycetota bacterium]